MHDYYASHKALPAMVFGLKPNKDVVVLTMQWDDYDDKQHTYDMYAAIFQGEQVTMYSFISEVWYRKTTNPDEGLPSEHPDRQSALMIVTSDGEKTIGDMYLIVGKALIKDNTGILFEDQIDLFKRIPALPKEALDELLNIEKPKWYNTFKEFI